MLLVHVDSSTIRTSGSDLNLIILTTRKFLENDNIFTARRGLHQNRKRRESPFDLSFTFYCYRFKQYHKRHLSITQALSEVGKLERM